MNVGLAFAVVMLHLVPLPIRGAKMSAWIGALMAPLQSLNNGLVTWVSAKRYAMQFNGQEMYLEHYLNDVFDSQRRIYIDDPGGTVVLSDYVWNKPEVQNDLVIYNKSEAAQTAIIENIAPVGKGDFVVFVPTGIYSLAIEKVMRRHIDQYRIAGKVYTFQPF
jgi:hypothetical protein